MGYAKRSFIVSGSTRAEWSSRDAQVVNAIRFGHRQTVGGVRVDLAVNVGHDGHICANHVRTESSAASGVPSHFLRE